MRREFRAVLTGEYGAPVWPSNALPHQRIALPRALTRKQAASMQRVVSKGGADYLNPQRRLGAAA